MKRRREIGGELVLVDVGHELPLVGEGSVVVAGDLFQHQTSGVPDAERLLQDFDRRLSRQRRGRREGKRAPLAPSPLPQGRPLKNYGRKGRTRSHALRGNARLDALRPGSGMTRCHPPCSPWTGRRASRRAFPRRAWERVRPSPRLFQQPPRREGGKALLTPPSRSWPGSAACRRRSRAAGRCDTPAAAAAPPSPSAAGTPARRARRSPRRPGAATSSSPSQAMAITGPPRALISSRLLITLS